MSFESARLYRYLRKKGAATRKGIQQKGPRLTRSLEALLPAIEILKAAGLVEEQLPCFRKPYRPRVIYITNEADRLPADAKVVEHYRPRLLHPFSKTNQPNHKRTGRKYIQRNALGQFMKVHPLSALRLKDRKPRKIPPKRIWQPPKCKLGPDGCTFYAVDGNTPENGFDRFGRNGGSRRATAPGSKQRTPKPPTPARFDGRMSTKEFIEATRPDYSSWDDDSGGRI